MTIPPKRATLSATPKMLEVSREKLPTPEETAKPRSHLRRSTRVGEVYWCDFNPHNWPPEFDYKHLVVIARGGKKEGEAHVVVPLTKRPQVGNPHGYKLIHNPNPGSADESWAVCDHIYTVASERLEPLRDSRGEKKEPQKVTAEDLKEISRRVLGALKPFLVHGFAAGA